MGKVSQESALPVSVESFARASELLDTMQRCLEIAKSLGATDAEVAMSATVGVSVEVRNIEVEQIEFQREKSAAITVFRGQHRGSASTSDMGLDSLKATVSAANDIAKMTEADEYAGLPNADDLATIIPDCDMYHPWAFSIDEAIELAKAMESAGRADKRIINTDGISLSSSQHVVAYANSKGFMGSYPVSRHGLSCVFIAEKDGHMERDYAYDSVRNFKDMCDPEALGRLAAQKTIKRLGAQQLTTRRCPVIFDKELASGFWGGLFSAISGGAQYRKTTCLLNALHEQVLPEFVHLEQQPHEKGGVGSQPFDMEGVRTRQMKFVDSGRIENYVLSSYTGRQLKMPTTGNSGGVFNIKVASHAPERITSLDEGLLITDMMGHGLNLITGDYSRGAFGYWVENGKIQYPVHEITVAGNIKDMFKNIQAIGDDVDMRKNIQTGSILLKEMSVAGR